MHLLGDAGEHRDVLVAPQAEFDVRCNVCRVVDFHHLGADHGPAAFRLHAAHGGQCGGVLVAHAVAVRHLVEAVACGDGADADGLEEDVVAGIAGHAGFPWLLNRF